MVFKAGFVFLAILARSTIISAFLEDLELNDDKILEEKVARDVFAKFHSHFEREQDYAKESQEFEDRFQIFWDNMHFIAEHNKKDLSWTVGLNHLADLTEDEIDMMKGHAYAGPPLEEAPATGDLKSTVGGAQDASEGMQDRDLILPNELYNINATYDPFPKSVPGHSECRYRLKDVEPVDYVDWREAGVVAEVKDQKGCGSCWIFATVAAAESIYAIKTGTLHTLSEQMPTDCGWMVNHTACHGGNIEEGWKMYTGLGLMTLEDYPWTPKRMNEQCEASRWYGKALFHIDTYEMLPPGELALKKALTMQPVAVAMDASAREFLFYKRGLYDPPDCKSESPHDLDHAVTAVGYVEPKEGKQGYFIVRNHWRKSWGIDGYLHLPMDRGDYGPCGIARYASRPVMDGEDQFHLHSRLPEWAMKARLQVAKNVVAHGRTVMNPELNKQPASLGKKIVDEVAKVSKMARKVLG